MDSRMRESKNRGTPRFPFELYTMYTKKKKIFVACHWQEETEILRVKSGEVELILNGIIHTLSEGDIAFINPGQLHQLHGMTMDTMYYAYVFPMEFLAFEQEDIVQSQIISPVLEQTIGFPNLVKCGSSLHQSILYLVDEIIEINKERLPMYEFRTKILLLELLCLLKQENGFVSHFAVKQVDVCKNILSYIKKHYSEKITVAAIAGEVGLSENYFSAFFTEHFDMSFINYLTMYRIEQACTLLETTDLPITEIALQTGFESISYFISKFKTVNGLTPNKYRNRFLRNADKYRKS
ncbi:MAG: helix-turn-helix transcriptional regulator [Lachnospiraceae bacterium]|nr:helix-turn-helix transcriptional regulator [Lachnospiraceae bacterium]